jgi:hypothetical protein
MTMWWRLRFPDCDTESYLTSPTLCNTHLLRRALQDQIALVHSDFYRGLRHCP